MIHSLRNFQNAGREGVCVAKYKVLFKPQVWNNAFFHNTTYIIANIFATVNLYNKQRKNENGIVLLLPN